MESKIHITHPAWLPSFVDRDRLYVGDEARMRLAIDLARQNVLHGTGGPFGAAIFERDSGRLVGVGVNSVVRLNNSALHAEMVAFMMAEADVESYTLGGDRRPGHEIFSSCEPCAMCLGAVLWSGVTRLAYAASREDADRLAFDEGPVFAQSYEYLRERGVLVTADVLREEAVAVLALYQSRGGQIYNG